MLRSYVLRLPRAALFCLLLASGASVTSPASAEASQNAAILEEAEKLGDKARTLADAGDLAGAISAVEHSLSLQEQQIIPTLPEAARPLFRVELTESKLFLIDLYLKQGDFTRGAALLEAEIRFHEGLSSGDRFADQVSGWKQALPKLRSNALLARVKRGIELHEGDRDSEALLVLREVLPALDNESGIAPAQLASANLIAARVLAKALAYSEAEARYLRALEYGEQAFGKAAPELIGCLGELGQLALTRGLPERGAKYLVRAHDIAKASARDELPSTVKDLGLLLSHRGDHAAAISVLTRALALYSAQSTPSAALGKLATRLYLASVQDDAGQFEQAEASYVALGRELDALLAQQPALLGLKAVYLRSYGVHHLRQAHYPRAEQLLLEAQAVTARVLPPGSPTALKQGCDLGEVYWASGDLARSLDPIGRCFDAREDDIARVLATGTEEQKRAFLGSYLVAFQKTMNAQRLGGNDNVKLNRLALTQVLRTKGRVLDAMTKGGLASRAQETEETRGLMQRLVSVRASMANLASSGLGSASELKRLGDEAAELENKLTQDSAGYRAATQHIDVASVQAKLGSDDALLEIVEYRPLDAHYRKAEPELRYLAYVVQSSGEPRAFDLGPASAIDGAVNRLRAALRRPDRDALAPARALHDLVMKPLGSAFGDKRHVFVAPDGALSAVPFAALADANGFLLEKYDFTYLTSGRELLRFGVESPATGPVVAFANPEFGAPEGQANAKVSSGATKLSRVVFEPLPGTQAEADELRRLFPEAVVRTGADASEAEVKRVKRPFVLHLATHGYFLPTQSLATLRNADGSALDTESAGQRLAVAENPLIRSGLAFAGATGLRGRDGEDGVLTALEASSLDLAGTQLVVLSACQTAEGEISQGEGVYGLRRALTIAGAESLVMSLWSVDDEATSYLMRGYYRRLKEGMGRTAALRDVQRVLAGRAATQHPYFWAAFIPSGNPGPVVLPKDAQGQPIGSSATSSATTSSSSSSSSDDDDDDDWETATPDFGMSVGAARLTLTPNAVGPQKQGYQGYVSIDGSPIAAAWSEDLGNESRGLVVYDRLGVNLALLTVSGDSLAALSWEYSLLLGYRARLVGLFAGLRYGSGTVTVSDGPKNTGSYFPFAGRLELPWFWDSRLSAVGYYGALFDRREAVGVDVRIPLGGPSLWLQGGFARTAGKAGQDNYGLVVPISLGFSETD